MIARLVTRRWRKGRDFFVALLPVWGTSLSLALVCIVTDLKAV